VLWDWCRCMLPSAVLCTLWWCMGSVLHMCTHVFRCWNIACKQMNQQDLLSLLEVFSTVCYMCNQLA
jgi:hypothetical protein